jgi:hypothetical protein
MSAVELEPYGLVAVDGADDDGGTLYVLLDAGRAVLSAAWPHPLHQYAAQQGRSVERLPAWDGRPDDHRDMLADLDPLWGQRSSF